jgi:hypothetical protein
MAIDNVKASITPVELQTANAAELVNTLPQAAVYADAFQPLYSAINPSVMYPFSPNPAPFTVSASAANLFATPGAFASTLSGFGGLDSALDSAGSAVDSAEADYTAGLNDPNISQKDMQKLGLAYQKALGRFQAISQLMSQIESIKLKLAEDTIRNLKG